MRYPSYRALILMASAFICLLVAGCNTTGLPEASPATPSPKPVSTATAVAFLPDSPTPQRSLPTSTAISRPNTPTIEAGATETELNPQATDTEVTVQATDTTAANTSPTPLPAEAATAEAENKKTLQQIEQQDVQFRGLQPLATVPANFITSDQLRQNLTKELEQNYSKEDAKRDAQELWLMRLMDDPSTDLYQLEIDLESEQVLGYYDQKVKALFVRNDGTLLSPTARETLAHEYIHALQDQHYDLTKLLPDKTTDGDKATAIRSLVEGDATVGGLLFAQRYFSPQDYQSIINESKNAPSTVLDRAPKYISDSLYFPYDQGVQFVIALGIMNSFKPIDKAFGSPPVSTEQIMHPEKYMNTPRDMPKPVALPPLTDTLGVGWTHNDNGTLGEFDFSEILDQNGATDAATAAAGWGGAVYEFYENGDKSLLMINTTWDTKQDANEFEDALKETFALNNNNGNIILDDDGLRFYSIKRVGDKIALGASTDEAALTKAMAAIK